MTVIATHYLRSDSTVRINGFDCVSWATFKVRDDGRVTVVRTVEYVFRGEPRTDESERYTLDAAKARKVWAMLRHEFAMQPAAEYARAA